MNIKFIGSWEKKQQIKVNKAEGQLEFLSAESAELGQDYQLIGALSPALEGETLSLKILGPDASVQEAELSSQTQGGFKHQFKYEQKEVLEVQVKLRQVKKNPTGWNNG